MIRIDLRSDTVTHPTDAMRRAMAEAEGRQPDVAAAWQDMYEYNGAQPLECHA